MENWDNVWRRNQFICAEISHRSPSTKILFVGLPRDISHDLRRGRIMDSFSRTGSSVPGLPNISTLQPVKLFPNSLVVGRKLNELIARWQIRRAAAKLGMGAALLWLNPHSAVHMVSRMGESGTIYDITDDWISPIQSDKSRKLITDQDAELCRAADSVIVCSQKLYDMKQGLAKDLHLVPNGVDVDHYSKVMDAAGSIPQEGCAWTKPVLGYTGTIHPERVDVSLVIRLAQKFVNGTIALVGPNLLPTQDRAKLAELGNVVLTGPVAYQNLPDYMRTFDVCITPHCMSEFTESLNPIKLWEYLASGKPVVSTNVAGFRDYSHLVHVANNADEFIQACEIALNEPCDLGKLRIAEAHKHTWTTRVDQIVSIIEGIGKPR
jgi:glycosyltransferase involved in cell wall biosynthesis